MSKKDKQLILLVEDELSMAKMIQQYLKKEPFDIHHVDNGQDALSVLDGRLPQVVLLDLNLPDMDGMDILKYIKEKQFPTSVIIITAYGSVDTAVNAMQLGALDFLEKPFSGDRLLTTVRNTLERQGLTDIINTLKDAERAGFHDFVGSSSKMHTVYRTIENVASSKASVLITGESGTGKELCAKAIHELSPRSKKPFIAINCAAIPKMLMESEIFGHLKGAFTGATSQRVGAMASASCGTLFLDEICEMDLELQAKLLRVIQMEEVQKVGSDKVEKIDVRIISATNRDPLSEVNQGRFREDLYYRLNVIPIELPPLRERENDVIELAREFVNEISGIESKDFTGLAPETESILGLYGWPGNIRELYNILQNIIINNNGDLISPDMLPSPLDTIINNSAESQSGIENVIDIKVKIKGEDTVSIAKDDIKPMWQVEKDHIEKIVDKYEGNIPKAAALLGVSPSTIYRKMQSWKGEESN